MSLYAIGDLHLHFQSVLKAPGQLHGRVWKNHEQKFLKNCRRLITPEDTLVLAGDHSWGKNLAECGEDLQYIMDLPGRKILTRGNHDMFWDVKKTRQLNEQFSPALTFLQDSYESYRDYAIVGTKGFTFEGPFYLDRRGRITGWDEREEERAKKLVAREQVRLRKSFDLARKDGYRKFDQHSGAEKLLYRYGGGVRGGAGDLRPLPRGVQISRQHYGRVPRSPLQPGVGRLSAVESHEGPGLRRKAAQGLHAGGFPGGCLYIAFCTHVIRPWA